MKYLMLIYEDEKNVAGMSEAQMGEWMQKWYAYDANLRQKTTVIDGNALQPTMTATTVRDGGAKPITSDGPFAETKEQLGGYYLIDAKDLDEAIEAANGMPILGNGGSVELRPIMEIPSQ